jgi:pimeloyl-ACP methyl ester carboxylesterase
VIALDAGGRRAGAVVLAVLLVLAGGCRADQGAADTATTTTAPVESTTTTTATEDTSTSHPPTTVADREGIAGAPGAVLRSTELDAGDLPGRVFRITYWSRSVDGGSVVVGGIIAVPDGDVPPAGFPVLAWAHGTTGIADRCAPSRRGVDAVPRLRLHLEAGYVVAATDYEGLGTPGVHPYLVAESEARSVLDSVRAARELLGEEVASDRMVVLGHSQGGHAALAAAERASSWAPELELIGTAAIAPVADLDLVLPAMFDSTVGLALGIYVAVGWSGTYAELAAADLLSEEGLDLLGDASRSCVVEFEDRVAGSDADLLRIRQPRDLPAWSQRIEENTIHPEAVEGPVLVAQGGEDQITPGPLVEPLIDGLCDAGVPLRRLFHSTADHGTIVGATMPAVHRWFAALLDGQVRDDCRRG